MDSWNVNERVQNQKFLLHSFLAAERVILTDIAAGDNGHHHQELFGPQLLAEDTGLASIRLPRVAS